MSQKKFLIIALVALIVLFISIGGYFIVNKMTDWETYKDTQDGFEFKYPAGSTIRKEESPSYSYIRLQNYPPNDKQGGLSVGEYYLEVFIFNHRKGQEMGSLAKNQLSSPEKLR
jgi:hypothetical protein